MQVLDSGVCCQQIISPAAHNTPCQLDCIDCSDNAINLLVVQFSYRLGIQGVRTLCMPNNKLGTQTTKRKTGQAIARQVQHKQLIIGGAL